MHGQRLRIAVRLSARMQARPTSSARFSVENGNNSRQVIKADAEPPGSAIPDPADQGRDQGRPQHDTSALEAGWRAGNRPQRHIALIVLGAQANRQHDKKHRPPDDEINGEDRKKRHVILLHNALLVTHSSANRNQFPARCIKSHKETKRAALFGTAP
ncbi:hypothetical protein Ddc_21196 [Ditylenchus destructor]|nr:hypothetical protein Ddc_21196 [Ditylenchus destructor]